jgi:hypothetical protein
MDDNPIRSAGDGYRGNRFALSGDGPNDDLTVDVVDGSVVVRSESDARQAGGNEPIICPKNGEEERRKARKRGELVPSEIREKLDLEDV